MTAVRNMPLWIQRCCLAGAALCLGCQPEAIPPSAVSPTAAASPEPVALSADSSLAIKRGTARLTTENRTFLPCGETAELWLAGEGEFLDETYSRLAGEPGAPLYVEVRGERTATPAGTSVPAGFAQTFLLEEVLFAALPGEGGDCDAVPPDYRVRAAGNEPFWSVAVVADRMVLHLPEMPAPLELSVGESQDSEGTVTYRGAGAGRTLELTIAAQSCSDSMSGAYFAYTAAGRLDDIDLHGCARLGE